MGYALSTIHNSKVEIVLTLAGIYIVVTSCKEKQYPVECVDNTYNI